MSGLSYAARRRAYFGGNDDEVLDLPRSWWSFEPGGSFGKITLSIPLNGAARTLFARDVHLFPSSTSTTSLLNWLYSAMEKDRCAIWRFAGEDAGDSTELRNMYYPEACFWTLWYRRLTRSLDTLSYEALLQLRANVQGTPSDTSELVHLLHIMFSLPSRHVITRLSEAMVDNNVEDIQTYGPVCLNLSSMLDDYDAKFCKWMYREVVLRALGVNSDTDDGTVLWTHSVLNEWQERLEFVVDDFRQLQDEQRQMLEAAQAGNPSPMSSPLPQDSDVGRGSLPLPPVNTQQVQVEASPRPSRTRQTASPFNSERNQAAFSSPTMDMADSVDGEINVSVREFAGERNGSPPSTPVRRMKGARVVVSDCNPGVPPSPVLHAGLAAGTLLSPSSMRGRPLHAELYYEIVRPHSLNLLTRLYEGFLLPSDANETYMPVAIKEITAVGSDAWIESQRWERELTVRRELGAVAEDVAYPILGIYRRSAALPIFVSPWSSYGNITQYIAKQANEDQFDYPDAVLDLMIQLLRVVADVHAAGIVHGNIKGNNVIVTANGELRLCGFGAYRTDRNNVSSVVLADEHAIVVQKSEPFMSPELCDSGCPTMESDMWAVSCVCIEMYFARSGNLDVGALMTSDEQNRPPIHVQIPDHVWDILELNWSLEPSDRLTAQAMYLHLLALGSPFGPQSSRN